MAFALAEALASAKLKLCITRPAKRKNTYSLACRLKVGIGNSWADGWYAWFSDAGRRCRRLDEMNLDTWHFIEAQHVIAVEITLYNSALVQRKLRFQDGTKAKADAAFYLGPHLVGIDSDAAIDSTDHSVNAGCAYLVHRDLGNLGHRVANHHVWRLYQSLTSLVA